MPTTSASAGALGSVGTARPHSARRGRSPPRGEGAAQPPSSLGWEEDRRARHALPLPLTSPLPLPLPPPLPFPLSLTDPTPNPRPNPCQASEPRAAARRLHRGHRRALRPALRRPLRVPLRPARDDRASARGVTRGPHRGERRGAEGGEAMADAERILATAAGECRRGPGGAGLRSAAGEGGLALCQDRRLTLTITLTLTLTR